MLGKNQLAREVERAEPGEPVYDQAHDTERSYDEACTIVNKRA
ncbi:MAG: hypothetical protein SVW77_01655 [Candidatus Nanohaloarchaea archaeon]|nr:hypothetical protein [Candidatus Nanohaloarchaea archaeon]